MYIHICTSYLQFSSFDSSVLPQLEGPPSKSTTLEFSNIETNIYGGHYCLPETSEVKYHPISNLKYDDVEEFVWNRKWRTNNNLKKAEVYSTMSDLHDGISRTEEYEKDQSSLSFSIVITCIISGGVAALMAVLITRKHVSILC